MPAGSPARSDGRGDGRAAPAYPQLVPDGVLDPPFKDELRSLLRRESAELLDFHLQHLASHEARCRLTLGRLAGVFLRRRGYRELGFVRVGDYARERLGLSARQLQSLVQVTEWLDGHPELVRAFQAGEISWTELRKRASSVDAADADAKADDSDDLIEGEAAVEFRLPCPPSVRFLWRQAVELASRASGSSLTYWQAAEVIAAEALGGLGGGEPQAEAQAQSQSPPGLGAGSKGSAASSRPESLTSEAALSTPSTEQPAAYDYPEIGLGDEPLLPDPPPKTLFPNSILPADVAHLTRGLVAITPHELDARLRRAVSAIQSLDWQTGRLLRTFFSLRLHRELGFSSTSLYIRSRLHLSVRKARGLVAIERATLLRCPELSLAYRCGRISWLRALAILPVLTEDRGHLWVARAARVTLRRLHDEVTWALNRADAGGGRSGLTPPPLGATIDTLDSDLAAAVGASADKPDPTTAVHSGARCGGDGDSDTDTDGASYGCGGASFSSVTIRFFGPLTVVALLEEAIERARRPGERRWRTMERLLRLVMQEWNNLPRHRDPVFARDGWRCSVPACSSRRNLQDHHVVFRSQGGNNRLDNRVAICASHHLHAIHTGSMLAKRTRTGALHWQLGTRGGGRPLMSLLGDVYIYGAPSEH